MGLFLLACIIIGGITGLIYRAYFGENQLSLSYILLRSVIGTIVIGLLVNWFLASAAYGWQFALAVSWVGGVITLMMFTSQKVKKKRPVYY